MTAVLVVCVLMLVAVVALMVRNHLVFAYRRKILDEIRPLARADIQAGRPWEWRYAVFNEVSYHRMVWMFWRRPSSFFDGHPALRRAS